MKAFRVWMLCLAVLACGRNPESAIREVEKPLVHGLGEDPEIQTTKPASRPKPIGPGIWDVESEHWITVAVKLDPDLDVKNTDLSWTQGGRAYFTQTASGLTVFLGPHAAFETQGVTLFFREKEGRLIEVKALAHRFRDYGPPFYLPLKLRDGKIWVKSLDLKRGSRIAARFELCGESEFTGTFLGKIP